MRFLDRIRNRTALYFGVASLVPLAALAVLLHAQVAASLRTTAARLNRAMVGSVLSGIEHRLEFCRGQLAAVARSPEVQSLQGERQARVLREFLDYNGVFFKVLTLDREGRLLAVQWRSGYRGEEPLLGRDARDLDARMAEAARRAVAEGRVVGSAPTVDAFSQPVVHFVAPVRDFVHEERVVGAVAGGVLLYGSEIQGLLDRADLPGRSYACVVDDGGQILARRGETLPATAGRHRWPMSDEGRPVDYLHTSAELREGVAVVGGRPVLLTAARLPDLGLRLLVGQPMDQIEAPARRAAVRAAFLTLGALGLSILLSVLLSRSLTRPLTALAAGIRTVGEGNVAHRIAVERDDELGSAAAAFNELAADLERRQLVEELWAERWPPR